MTRNTRMSPRDMRRIAANLSQESSILVWDIACCWCYLIFQLVSSHMMGVVVAVDIVLSAFINMRRKQFEPITSPQLEGRKGEISP